MYWNNLNTKLPQQEWNRNNIKDKLSNSTSYSSTSVMKGTNSTNSAQQAHIDYIERSKNSKGKDPNLDNNYLTMNFYKFMNKHFNHLLIKQDSFSISYIANVTHYISFMLYPLTMIFINDSRM